MLKLDIATIVENGINSLFPHEFHDSPLLKQTTQSITNAIWTQLSIATKSAAAPSSNSSPSGPSSGSASSSQPSLDESDQRLLLLHHIIECDPATLQMFWSNFKNNIEPHMNKSSSPPSKPSSSPYAYFTLIEIKCRLGEISMPRIIDRYFDATLALHNMDILFSQHENPTNNTDPTHFWAYDHASLTITHWFILQH